MGRQSCDGVGGFTCKEHVVLIEREIQVTVLCKKVTFCHVQTCDETKFNGESLRGLS